VKTSTGGFKFMQTALAAGGRPIIGAFKSLYIDILILYF
jgi:hypothetical protein